MPRCQAVQTVGRKRIRIGPRHSCSGSTVTVLPYGSTWRFDDQGADLGTAWRSASYVDTAWRQGKAQLGFGESDEATVISAGPDTDRILTTGAAGGTPCVRATSSARLGSQPLTTPVVGSFAQPELGSAGDFLPRSLPAPSS